MTIKSPEINVFVGERDRVKDVATFRRAELMPLSMMLMEAAVMKLVWEFEGGVRV